jgi:hypothetical protein
MLFKSRFSQTKVVARKESCLSDQNRKPLQIDAAIVRIMTHRRVIDHNSIMYDTHLEFMTS